MQSATNKPRAVAGRKRSIMIGNLGQIRGFENENFNLRNKTVLFKNQNLDQNLLMYED